MANNDRIVGGQKAESPIPWQVSLRRCSTGNCQQSVVFYCGGTILDSKTILTAAHCVDSQGVDYTQHFVMAGSTSVLGGQNVKIAQVINHPGWNSDTNDNDISILKLAEPLNLNSNAQAMCLPSENFDPANGAKCYVSGWGRLEYQGAGSGGDLRWVSVPKVSQSSCKNAYWYLTDNMICAGEEQGGKDSCSGDSGGPFVCMENGNPVVTGVVSFGNGCALEGYPGVYARVTQYLPWIKSHMEVPAPPPSTCSKPHWIGDGFCDDSTNNAECDFDGGDCCGNDVKTYWCSVCECKCKAPNQNWIGDGWCDDVTNTAECQFDGGDCCGDDVKTYWCSACECKKP